LSRARAHNLIATRSQTRSVCKKTLVGRFGSIDVNNFPFNTEFWWEIKTSSGTSVEPEVVRNSPSRNTVASGANVGIHFGVISRKSLI
jgi:hypothetical protein